MRKDLLVNGQYYHVLSKSIAGYIIFNNDQEYLRIINLLRFYQNKRPPIRFSMFNQLSLFEQNQFLSKNPLTDENKLVEIIAYCIMPTRIHLILEQLLNGGISLFIKNILISYTKFFNLRHQRKGPLWEGRFKNVLVDNDSQLLHLTRYIHLNPVSAGLVEQPEDWSASSYKEYLGEIEPDRYITKFNHILDIHQTSYKKFVNNRIAYQKQLTRLKKVILENQIQP